MPVAYRPWISPYGDDDFAWDRKKSLATFDDRDLVFEAARIERRRRSREPRSMVLGELYGRVIAIIYTPRSGKCRIISLRLANTVEREIYHEYTTG